MLVRVSVIALALSAGMAQAEFVFGVTSNQTLVSFDSATPGVIASGTAISGLQSNERVRGLDFRPATGQLYALGSFSNLYTINTTTGVATQVGSSSFAPTLSGSSFGFDFNPTIDRIRIVSDTNQNLVVNPNTGAVQLAATNLFYGPGDANQGTDPNVVGAAYSNSFPGSTTTQLYGIDTGLDILVKQANNTGVLTTVGPLGSNITNLVGFDISGASGIAYAASQDVGQSISRLWTINLNTGLATQVGQIGGGTEISAIAVVPAPGALALVLGAGLVARRRR